MNTNYSVRKIIDEDDLNLIFNNLQDILSKAFFNDPYYVYIMPNEKKRTSHLKWWMKIMLKYSFKNGEIYVTSDNKGIKGVSLWCGPKKPTLNNIELALLGLINYPFEIGIKGFIRMLNVSTEWEKIHKKQNKNHYYLLVIGVDPEFQRKGIGSLLMKEILKKADSENLDCYLETVTEENMRFYEHHNFKSIIEKQFGMTYKYWAMRRTPLKKKQ